VEHELPGESLEALAPGGHRLAILPTGSRPVMKPDAGNHRSQPGSNKELADLVFLAESRPRNLHLLTSPAKPIPQRTSSRGLFQSRRRGSGLPVPLLLVKWHGRPFLWGALLLLSVTSSFRVSVPSFRQYQQAWSQFRSWFIETETSIHTGGASSVPRPPQTKG